MSKIKQLAKKHEPSIWVLKAMALLRLLLGNYANISESKPICLLMKIYCILCCSTIGAILLDGIQRNIIFSVYFLSIIEYISTAIVYLIYGDKRFLDFFNAITTNDRIMGFKEIPLLTYYTYLIIIGNSLIRLCVTAYHASVLKTNHKFFAISFSLCSVDVNHLTILVIFSILKSRMTKLKSFLKSNSVPIYITGRDEVAISVKNIRKSLYYYNNLLDNLQFVDKQLQYLLFVQWSSLCLKTMSLSYDIIRGIISENLSTYVVFYLIEIVKSLYVVAGPAFFVEATAHEVDQIKATLTGQLLRCSDESLRWVLQTSLQYVSLRPFSFTLCRAVSLNIYLPFTVISICITYVIVFLQLSHFSA